MSILSDIEAHVAVYAAEAVAATIAEGTHLGVELVADAKELGAEILASAKAELDKVESQVEDSFLALTQKYGSIASQFVTTLWPQTELGGVPLDGNSKSNLAAEQLVAAAANDGIQIASQDVSSMIKNAYLGVKDVINNLTNKAAAAIS